MDVAAGRESSRYSSIKYRSYGKINLYLDVLKKRRDGYHNIETIFQTVSLADELTFWDDTLISLTSEGQGLDTGPSNLICRAAALLRAGTNYPHGAHIHLDKRIPVSAGMAGGSANAAATLIALNKLWDLRLSPAQLFPYARKLGADVSYCLRGGTQAAWLRGDFMAPLPEPKGLWFVLVHPHIAVSAGQVYASPRLACSKEQPFAGRTPAFRTRIRALARGELSQVVFNAMERPVFESYRQLPEIRGVLLELGCEAAAMSGSGPTLFGVCRSQQQALRVAEGMKQYNKGCNCSVASTTHVCVERIA